MAPVQAEAAAQMAAVAKVPVLGVAVRRCTARGIRNFGASSSGTDFGRLRRNARTPPGDRPPAAGRAPRDHCISAAPRSSPEPSIARALPLVGGAYSRVTA
jgi:hypothetical protein